MTTQCRYCPLQRKDAFIPMSKEELSFMEKFKSGELTVEPGTPILLEGSNAPQLYTALTGMGIRDKTLENGNRQVISFVFPGDFIGLHGKPKEFLIYFSAALYSSFFLINNLDLRSLF